MTDEKVIERIAWAFINNTADAKGIDITDVSLEDVFECCVDHVETIMLTSAKILAKQQKEAKLLTAKIMSDIYKDKLKGQ